MSGPVVILISIRSFRFLSSVPSFLKMSSVSICTCPLCPLEAKNVQLCNVYVTFFPKRKVVYVKNCDDLTIHEPIITLVSIHRAELNMDIPKTWEANKTTYTLEKIADNRYKVCIHVKNRDT